MSVRTNSNQVEEAEEGEYELVLTAVTYTGDRSLFSNLSAAQQQGGYPSYDPFQQGGTKLVKLPDRHLGWWETHADFEVAYDPESIAATLLGKNYLPSSLVGPAINQEIQQEFMDKLDLKPYAGEEDLREQLAAIVGIEEDGEQAPDRMRQDRAQELVEENDRSVLVKVVGSFDDEEVEAFEEEHGVDSYGYAPNTALGEFLAGKSTELVRRKLDAAEMGNL